MATSAEVRAFLERIEPLTRAEVEQRRSDLLPQMKPWGAAWAALAKEVGVACPALLIELGDVMAEVIVYFSIATQTGRTRWSLMTPEEAKQTREFMLQFAQRNPDLKPRAEMLPVFGADGDLLLLAADGRLHGFTHDRWERDGVCADDLVELLAKATRAPLNPPR